MLYPSRVTVTDSWVELCTNMILCQELGEGEGGEGAREVGQDGAWGQCSEFVDVEEPSLV